MMCKGEEFRGCFKFKQSKSTTKAFFKKREERSLQSSVSNLSFWERPAEKSDLRLAVIECRMLLKFGGRGGEWRGERH